MYHLFRVTAPYFTAGGEFGLTKEHSPEDGIDHVGAVRLAPIIGYMLGWEESRVIQYCNKKGWKYENLG